MGGRGSPTTDEGRIAARSAARGRTIRGMGHRLVLAALAALALALPATAHAGPVAASQGDYMAYGRVFPDPQSQASCPGGPCSPHRQGNVPAQSFIGYQELVSGLDFMNRTPQWARYLEVWT